MFCANYPPATARELQTGRTGTRGGRGRTVTGCEKGEESGRRPRRTNAISGRRSARQGAPWRAEFYPGRYGHRAGGRGEMSMLYVLEFWWMRFEKAFNEVGKK